MCLSKIIERLHVCDVSDDCKLCTISTMDASFISLLVSQPAATIQQPFHLSLYALMNAALTK